MNFIKILKWDIAKVEILVIIAFYSYNYNAIAGCRSSRTAFDPRAPVTTVPIHLGAAYDLASDSADVLASIPRVDPNDYTYLKDLNSGRFKRIALYRYRDTPFAGATVFSQSSPFSTHREILAHFHLRESPHIIGFQGYCTHPNGHIVFFCEYAPHGTLFDRYRDQPATPREAAQIAVQLLQGVTEIHAAGYVHRDMKPDNVLLTSPAGAPQATIKITDFGRAVHFRDQEYLSHHSFLPGAGAIAYTHPYQLDMRNPYHQFDTPQEWSQWIQQAQPDQIEDLFAHYRRYDWWSTALTLLNIILGDLARWQKASDGFTLEVQISELTQQVIDEAIRTSVAHWEHPFPAVSQVLRQILRCGLDLGNSADGGRQVTFLPQCDLEALSRRLNEILTSSLTIDDVESL